MRWQGSPRSSNETDRRGGGAVAVGGGLGGILMVVLYLVLGGDPTEHGGLLRTDVLSPRAGFVGDGALLLSV